MNLIRTATSTPKHCFSSIAIHQVSPFSTTTDCSVPKPKTPRPSTVPYQPKLPNFVKLFGIVQLPIHFQTTPDGEHIATTLISQNDGAFIGNSSNSVSIPVLFQGDLACTVASYVKRNDCVCVSAKLSLNPLQFIFREYQELFYLVGNEINFVQGLENNNVVEQEGLEGGIEGFERRVDGKRLDSDSSTPAWVYKKLDELNLKRIEPIIAENTSTINVGGATKEADSVFSSWLDLLENPTEWWDYREKKSVGLLRAKCPDFKHKSNGTDLWLNVAPNWVLTGLGGLDVGKSAKDDSWKNLFENPDKWWDNRPRKTSVKSPDFKHKETGEGLWLNSSPKWVRSGLEGLDGFERRVDGKRLDSDSFTINVGGATNDADSVFSSWLDLLENPTEWWDYRERKSVGLVRAKCPDFKHKTDGTYLWLNVAPNWVLAGLEGLNVGRSKKEDSWIDVFKNPEKWLDNRPTKTSVNSPDFKHKETGEGLWIDSSPKWVLSGLEGHNVGQGKNEDSWKNLVDKSDKWLDLVKNPTDWWDNREDKSSGSIKAERPDFKHKTTGIVLWLDAAPNWVFAELEGLNLGRSEKEDNWNNLVVNSHKWLDLIKNPEKWWDDRERKLIGLVNAKCPDFKHKSNETALWLNEAPKWVLPRLERLNLGRCKKEDSWKNLVENPDKWLDNRPRKINVKVPDFIHKETGEGLWLNCSPKWVSSQLPCENIEHGV